MKIAILVLSASKYFGRKGTYNLQEVGLAKELSRRGHSVSVYKCVTSSKEFSQENICENVEISYVAVRTIGQHSLFHPSILDSNVDVLVCFSDNQISTPKVYQWARKNQIIFIPYIGSFESTSPKVMKRFFMDTLFKVSCHAYRNSWFLAKTNYVSSNLSKQGINHIEVAPVGLDFDLLNGNYKQENREILKKKWSYQNEEKIVLMVGRLESDRNPLDCIPVFKRIYQSDPAYRFLIIGSGSLKAELKEKLEGLGLLGVTSFIESIPNSQMWEAYCITDYMVSFSHTEIFGMSILEAMYYEKPVFALHAPGPDDIIEDGKTGYLFDTPEQMAEEFFNKPIKGIGEKGSKRIREFFTWKTTADQIEKIIDYGTMHRGEI